MDLETAQSMSANERTAKVLQYASVALIFPAAYVGLRGQLEFTGIFLGIALLGHTLSQATLAVSTLQDAVAETGRE